MKIVKFIMENRSKFESFMWYFLGVLNASGVVELNFRKTGDFEKDVQHALTFALSEFQERNDD